MVFRLRTSLVLTVSSRLTRMTPVSRKPSSSSPSAMSFFFSRVLWPSSSLRMILSLLFVLSSSTTSDLLAAGSAGLPADCRCIMVKRIIKRILVFSSVACLVLACVPFVSFAIDPVSGAAALAGALDAYGMAYGVGTVYDVSSSSGVSSSFDGLWDDFSEYQSNAGSQFDYDSYIDNYNQNRSLYGFEHSSGTFAAWSIDAESAEIFDQFWNWLLTGPAEMTRVDNEYFQFSQSQIGPDASPLTVYSYSSLSSYLIPYADSNLSDAQLSSSGSLIFSQYWSANDERFVTASASSSSSPVYGFWYSSGTSWRFTFVVTDSSIPTVSIRHDTAGNGSYTRTTYSSYTSNSDYPGLYYVSSGPFVSKTATGLSLYYPSYSSVTDGLNVLAPLISSGGDSSSVGVKAYGNGYVNVPDPTLPDYEPTPLEIVTNIPWDSSYDDTDEEDGSPVPFPPVDVPLVVDDIISAISAEDYALEEDPQDPDPDPPPPAPSEVFVPLLPVGLPSFNFSFSGIWHYVREWVASLGAWFTTLFSIWGALPYAMVVPVYATAVVVIVLGVYKRFFM